MLLSARPHFVPCFNPIDLYRFFLQDKALKAAEAIKFVRILMMPMPIVLMFPIVLVEIMTVCLWLGTNNL